MRKAFLTACNLNHAVGAEAILRGIARFHPDTRRYCIAPREEVVSVQERLGTLAEVLPPPREIKGVPQQAQMVVARLFAFTLPEDTVVYMDSDTIMCRPSPELWEVPSGKINAISDQGTKVTDNLPPQYREEFARRFPECARQKGFNSGVLGLNPCNWANFAERFEDAMTKVEWPKTEQPLLNALLLPHVNWLPRRYNFHSLFENRIPRNVHVVHYACANRIRPWTPNYPKHELAYYYWVRYGLHDERISTLAPLQLRMACAVPKKLIGKLYRRFYPASRASTYSGPM